MGTPEWRKGIKSFLETGIDPDDPELQYEEVPFEILLTSKYPVWREFAIRELERRNKN